MIKQGSQLPTKTDWGGGRLQGGNDNGKNTWLLGDPMGVAEKRKGPGNGFSCPRQSHPQQK